MPYETHPDLTTPRKETVVWRYMDFAKFIEMLESRSLWFARIDQLHDPLEGTHTDAELAGIREHLEKSKARRIIGIFRFARKELYASCWHAGSAESLAMWDLYGKGSGIVAIKSTVGRLRQAASNCDEPVLISRIKYVDWDDAPGLDNVLVACSRKDLSYQHESEVRVIIFAMANERTKGKLGVSLQVDLGRLLTEVMVGPREQKWVARLVERVMKRYGLSQPVTASNRLIPRR
jgi:hypothetical protein